MTVVFDKGLTKGCSGELEVMDDCCFRQGVVLGS